MNTQELYDYIDQRLLELDAEEKALLKSLDLDKACRCQVVINELWDLKNFIQAK